MRAGGTGQKTKSQIVPLVAVTEGTETVSKDRSRTQGTMYFTNPEFRGADVWESVSGYICNAYDVTKLEHVYVYGDGGKGQIEKVAIKPVFKPFLRHPSF